MSATELKLLTLLNVSAIKRPRARDLPGGFRSRSPSAAASGMSQQASIADDAEHVERNEKSAKANASSSANKRRRSVQFGGEVGPSGSTYGRGKGKKARVAPAGNGEEKGKGKAKVAMAVDEDEEDEEEGESDEGEEEVEEEVAAADEEIEAGDDSDDDDAGQDTFLSHFGPEPAVLTQSAIDAEEADKWTSHRENLRGLGRVVEMRPGETSAVEGKARIVPALASALKKSASPLASTYLSQFGSYTDLYAHSLDGEADGSEKAAFGPHREALRTAAAAHALNHVLKTRRKIVRTNEKLAHALAAGNDTAEFPRDQAFVRPKVLILLPLRSLALRWLKDHLFPLRGEGIQIENQRPFVASFSLPGDEEDPLDDKKRAAEFPVDHLENFRGNSDDNFRLGIKITRKAWRVVMPPANEAKLLECDILVASPLALKMAAERENSTDLLSCIEICVADGLDVLQMQNWDHVSYVFKNLNHQPQRTHGFDISRVKEWYLNGQAKLLRQTLLFSRYDTPEARSIFNRSCHNVAGKRRVDATASLHGVLGRVQPGVRQVFERFDTDAAKGAAAMSSEAAVDEIDARFEHFTKKTLPALLRSAVSRQNTILVIPSYFDFVRVTNYLRKKDEVSYAAISEYSSNSEISRARTLFFKGKRALLVITERLHFYRRYKLRGAKTIVFYALPDHAAFYSELLATPFIASKDMQAAGFEHDETVDPGEVSARTLFSRFDVLKLERVVGWEDARRMVASGEERFEFV